MLTICHAPRRYVRPRSQRVTRPRGGLVSVADIAGIRNFERVRLAWRYETKSVAPDIDIGNRLLDFRHMARHAFAAGASGLMMRVRLNGGGAGAVRRIWPMTLQAHHVRRLQKVRIILCSVGIMAMEATDSVRVHGALNEIVALHSVLVRSAIRKMSE